MQSVKVANEAMREYEYLATPTRICWFHQNNVDGLPDGLFRERLYAACWTVQGHMPEREYVSP